MQKSNFDSVHDKEVLKRSNRFVFITMIIAYIAICILSVYAVSVLDRNNVVRQIDKNVNSIVSYLEQGSKAGELAQKEFLDEYRTKTRVISVMIPVAAALEENEAILEEIRVAVDAEEVSVFTHGGDIVATTATYGKKVSIEPEFQDHINERNYNDAVFHSDEEKSYVAAASQLSDKGYILQITYDAESLIKLMNDSSIELVAKNFPLYSKGKTVLIDADSFEYVSHTDIKKIGTKCSVDPQKFKRNKSKFDEILSGETIMIRYHKYNDYIIAAFVPYDDIFNASYAVLGWMIAGGIVMLT
ncbi:MAG: hypothetical protein ACI4JN_00360, partial [Ruminococcus sp.]